MKVKSFPVLMSALQAVLDGQACAKGLSVDGEIQVPQKWTLKFAAAELALKPLEKQKGLIFEFVNGSNMEFETILNRFGVEKEFQELIEEILNDFHEGVLFENSLGTK